ncbi:MAG: helix-turn-helix transcriptional regulator [Christensenellaceae bacterium]|nr:helix-turn-helix transcriptional regulator [Christensenellaceae bacterium]
MQKFSNRLISLRKERSLTQEDFAKVINKKRSTVSGYETEGKEPDLKTICILAKYFGVTTDYLLGYSDERTPTESVFYNDTVNFEQHFKSMPPELRPVFAKCFDSLYLLLNRDMQFAPNGCVCTKSCFIPCNPFGLTFSRALRPLAMQLPTL